MQSPEPGVLAPSRVCGLLAGENGRVVDDRSLSGVWWEARRPCLCLHPLPCSPFCPQTQEVDAAEIQVQVCLYAFDLIYLNGQVSSAADLGAGGGCV